MTKSINSIVVLLTAILGCSFVGMAQTPLYVTLNSTTNANGVNYPVQTNQVVSVVGSDWVWQPQLFGNLADGTLIPLNPFAVLEQQQPGSGYVFVQTASSIPQIVTGLTNIIVKPSCFAGGCASAWATFQITTPVCTNLVSNYVPADAVVIPSSATGNVQIILEPSADLVNWTAANPGIYRCIVSNQQVFQGSRGYPVSLTGRHAASTGDGVLVVSCSGVFARCPT